jgi:hypothetical protein
MKKTFFTLLVIASGITANAQNLVSKKGEPFLPEKYDWSIGIDATPFLNYVGNIFNSSGNRAPLFNNYGLNQTFTGKYFEESGKAYRVILRLGLRNQSFKSPIAEIVATPIPNPTAAVNLLEDKAKVSSNFVGLGLGLEKRKGKTRLQGFFGADAFVWFNAESVKYTYGNKLTQGATANPNVDVNATSTTEFAGQFTFNGEAIANRGISDRTYGNAAGRALEYKAGTTIGLGVRGFLGAEYFIFPKISIGGEFGLGLGYQRQGKGSVVVESEQLLAGNEARIQTENDFSSSRSGFILDIDRNAANSATYNFAPSGQIRLNLHF